MEAVNSDTVLTLLDKPYAKVSFNNQYNVGIIVWRAHCTSTEYRAAFEAMLKFQRESSETTFYYISDIRNQGVVGPEDRKWFETYALPTAKSQGLVRAGTVISGNIFKQYYINLILATAKNFGFPLKAFKEWDECVTWLLDNNHAVIKYEDHA